MINFNDPLTKSVFDVIVKQANLPNIESLLDTYLTQLCEAYNDDLPQEQHIKKERLKHAFEAAGGFSPDFLGKS